MYYFPYMFSSPGGFELFFSNDSFFLTFIFFRKEDFPGAEFGSIPFPRVDIMAVQTVLKVWRKTDVDFLMLVTKENVDSEHTFTLDWNKKGNRSCL